MEKTLKTVNVIIRMDAETNKKLRKLALENDLSVSAYIRKLIKKQKFK